MKKTKVLLVDHQSIVRVGLRTLLENTEKFIVVGETAELERAIRLTSRHKPELIIIDTSISKTVGSKIIHSLRDIIPEVKIVVLTNNDNQEHFYDVLDAGARGYILKIVNTSEILHGIAVVMNDEKYFGSLISKRIIENHFRRTEKKAAEQLTMSHNLTKREIEILKLIADGLTNTKIAQKLYISFRTVHNHRNNLMRKLDVHNTADLVRFAVSVGLVKD